MTENEEDLLAWTGCIRNASFGQTHPGYSTLKRRKKNPAEPGPGLFYDDVFFFFFFFF